MELHSYKGEGDNWYCSSWVMYMLLEKMRLLEESGFFNCFKIYEGSPRTRDKCFFLM